ncbi:MAG: hypothetical protein IKN72_07795 [Clostridia bacterium]|nr:hypothetical protein [Clostridia bacterium]
MEKVRTEDAGLGEVFTNLFAAIKAFFNKLFNKSSGTSEIDVDAPEIKLPC